MAHSKTVLVIFADAADAQTWSPFCFQLPEAISIIADRFLGLTLENLSFADMEPRLAVVSSNLYPESRPGLIAELKSHFPQIEIMVIAAPCVPISGLDRFIADRVRHLMIESPPQQGCTARAHASLSHSIRNLVLKKRWDLSRHVRKGTPVHEFRLACSAEKEQIIGKLEEAIVGDGAEVEMLRQKGALLADELLENAFYGAPKSDDGLKMFRKGEKRQILPDEKMVFRFAFDGEVLAMEMRDGWGSLRPDTVLEYLTQNSAGHGVADDQGGRGLFIIWRFLDDLHVAIDPGRETLIGGHLKKSSPVPPEAMHGFHIITTDY